MKRLIKYNRELSVLKKKNWKDIHFKEIKKLKIY